MESPGPSWASLPADLFAHVAGLLKGEDRVAVMGACRPWRAALRRSPRLLPTAVLTFPRSVVVRACKDAWRFGPDYLTAPLILDAHDDDSAEAWTRLRMAHSLSPLQWRVRLAGSSEQPALILGVLLALPSTIRELELRLTAPQDTPEFLTRLRQLSSLSITSNGLEVAWDGPGGACALRALRRLVLDTRWPEREEETGLDNVDRLRDGLRESLAGAGALHTLTLSLRWSEDVARMCAALPALDHLRLSLYHCEPGDARAAVALLEGLPRLHRCGLAIHSFWGTERADEYPSFDLDTDPIGELRGKQWVHLPPLGAIAGLTALHVDGAASLPPDWRQLAALRHLQVSHDRQWAARQPYWSAGWGTFEWGPADDPLTALVSLTRLDLSSGAVLPDPALLATLPRLQALRAPGADEAWEARWRALRPAVIS